MLGFLGSSIFFLILSLDELSKVLIDLIAKTTDSLSQPLCLEPEAEWQHMVDLIKVKHLIWQSGSGAHSHRPTLPLGFTPSSLTGMIRTLSAHLSSTFMLPHWATFADIAQKIDTHFVWRRDLYFADKQNLICSSKIQALRFRQGAYFSDHPDQWVTLEACLYSRCSVIFPRLCVAVSSCNGLEH